MSNSDSLSWMATVGGRGLSSDVGVLAEAPSLCGIYTRNLTMFALPSLLPYKSRAALRDAGKCLSDFLYKSQLICIFMTSLACTLQVSICRTLQKEKKKSPNATLMNGKQHRDTHGTYGVSSARIFLQPLRFTRLHQQSRDQMDKKGGRHTVEYWSRWGILNKMRKQSSHWAQKPTSSKWNSSTWLSSYFTMLMTVQDILLNSAFSIRNIIS